MSYKGRTIGEIYKGNKMVDHWPKNYTLNDEEARLIQDYRREKDIMEKEAKVFRSNGTVESYSEQSPNMKAVEDIEKLNNYLKLHKITYSAFTVDNAIYCMQYRLASIIELTAELENKQTISYMNEYQNAAAETAIYPGKGTSLGLIYCALKLSGEAGEVAENVGKALRDDDYLLIFEKSGIAGFQELNYDRCNKIKLELGDVLWYVSQAAKELGFTLEEIAQANLEKLGNRAKNGTLKGSGDDR